MRLAVVIPVLDEAGALSATLDSLQAQEEVAARVLVVDGGSSDATLDVAKAHGVEVLMSPRQGRGCQIVHALRNLEEDAILVLHADMVVPNGALSLVRKLLETKPSCPGGCLGHRFDSPRAIYRVLEIWDATRARRGWSYGDQAQFFRQSALRGEGGFPDQPIMEDLELSRRMMRVGRPEYLNVPVLVSGRRFERLGFFRTVVTNLRLRLAYRLQGPKVGDALFRRYYGRSPTRK